MFFTATALTIKANDPQPFADHPQTQEQSNRFEDPEIQNDTQTTGVGVPGGGGGDGGGGVGTGQPVSLDMYEIALLFVGLSIMFYKMDIIRRKKVRLTHHNTEN